MRKRSSRRVQIGLTRKQWWLVIAALEAFSFRKDASKYTDELARMIDHIAHCLDKNARDTRSDEEVLWDFSIKSQG